MVRLPVDEELLDACVHCGFCLPACPTYDLWGEEMDSPRGRIHLMRQAVDGTVGLDDTVVGHLDACLGCLACVTACPSGVRYDVLIEHARADVEEHHVRSPADRVFRAAVHALFPHPRRLRAAAALLWAAQRLRLDRAATWPGVSRRLSARVVAALELAPRLRSPRPRRLPAVVAARGPRRRRVALVTGCVQSVFLSEVHTATVRVLAADGCEVVIPAGQGCCGALDLHDGREPAAQARARALVARLDRLDVDTIVVNAAGCGSTMKAYDRLLADDPLATAAARVAARTRDVTEVLAELEPRVPRRRLDLRIAYQDACHLRHGQGVADAPRRLLAAIPGVEVVDLDDPGRCCGSAGTYNLTQPDAAAALGRRRAADVLATGADVVATANPGCALQLRRHLRAAGADLPVLHPAQILDAAIR